ncbi:aminotransferase class I/II-fold pyridoxal phosphate-dependent enzyme [bacterium]|nr:aminotransferase class I/II-fold pyridoxal phosphate-dependent enzyme [bacterium]
MDFTQLAKRQYKEGLITRPDWTIDTSRDEKVLWLNKNENLDPVLNEQINGILKKIKPFAVNTYPENAKIYKKLAALDSLEPNNFILTSGSDGAIRNTFEVFIAPGDKVLHTHPTFAMYDVYCKMFAAEQIKVAYTYTPEGPVLDFNKFIEQIKVSQPKLVCLPNPDSPTGTVLTDEQMQILLKTTLELKCLLLIDEAYYPFFTKTQINKVNEFPQLLVCRTFSKAWGAAGVRVGYLAANKELIQIVHKNRAMYEVGTLSAEIIYQLLDYKTEILASVARLQEGRDYFKSELRKLGYQVTESHGNFLHVDFGTDESKIAQNLKDTVLYRTEFGDANCLKGFSRFSLGTKSQFELIMQKIRQIK